MIFGKSVSDYINFSRTVAGAILIVGIARLGLSLAGVANEESRWLSMTALLFVGVIYLGVRIHTSGFGSYARLLPVIAVPNVTLHLIAIVGILTGIVTGRDNVFTAPEFAFGADGKTVGHLLAHLLIGIPVGTIVNWIIGCIVLFITKLVVKR